MASLPRPSCPVLLAPPNTLLLLSDQKHSHKQEREEKTRKPHGMKAVREGSEMEDSLLCRRSGFWALFFISVSSCVMLLLGWRRAACSQQLCEALRSRCFLGQAWSCRPCPWSSLSETSRCHSSLLPTPRGGNIH